MQPPPPLPTSGRSTKPRRYQPPPPSPSMPPAPLRRAARSACSWLIWTPRRRRCGVGAALSQGIPLRSARDREPGRHLAARAQRRHPADPAAAQGARLRQDSELREKRIPAEDHHPLASGKARPDARTRWCRTSWSTGRCATASLDRIAARRPRRARLRAHPRHPALSAILRGDDRDGGRRRCSWCSKPCASSRRCASRRRTTTTPPISRRWRPRSMRRLHGSISSRT